MDYYSVGGENNSLTQAHRIVRIVEAKLALRGEETSHFLNILKGSALITSTGTARRNLNSFYFITLFNGNKKSKL